MSSGPRCWGLLGVLTLFWALTMPRASAADARGCEPAGGPATDLVDSSPALEVLRGPGFGLLRNAGGISEAACGPHQLAKQVLLDRVLEAQVSLGVDAQLVVLLTTQAPSCSSIYYLPIANDVGGIGYVHTEGRELFDDSPESRLEGIAFLNDWPYWSSRSEEFQSAFNHEVAHRWGARVHALIDGRDSAELLGREQAHWSYFLSSDGSPHEGNVWVERDSSYSAETPRYPALFSDLDLYLMGVAPPAEVAPFSLLRPSSSAPRDCRGAPLAASSPPSACAQLELRAEAREVTIEDIMGAEGPRAPAAESYRVIDVLVLLLDSPQAPLRSSDCTAFATSLRARFDGFGEAARGRMVLNPVLPFAADCALDCAALAEAVKVAPAPDAPGASGCSLRARAGNSVAGCAVFATLVWLARRRSERSASRRTLVRSRP